LITSSPYPDSLYRDELYHNEARANSDQKHKTLLSQLSWEVENPAQWIGQKITTLVKNGPLTRPELRIIRKCDHNGFGHGIADFDELNKKRPLLRKRQTRKSKWRRIFWLLLLSFWGVNLCYPLNSYSKS
jgi:hypothetical protein